ncbi:MAG: phage terminase large subunit family protein, partial [Verrucomicrobia bacterium]|nr:phage terminase large subunit family protein [Verrucomicrobiota bacterium]
VRYDESLMPVDETGDWEPFKLSVRYECEGCGHQFLPHEKLKLLKTCHKHVRNPNALPEHESMHWNQLAMPWASCGWDNIAVKFCQAMKALTVGNIEPLRSFVTETLGEPWREVRGEKAEESDILSRCGDYTMGQGWTDGKQAAILTVDVQKGFLVTVLRQYRPGRESRLLNACRMLDWSELERFADEHGVPAELVFVDTAFGDQTRPNDDNKALSACHEHGTWINDQWRGWNPMIGHRAKDFAMQQDGRVIKTHWKLELKTLGPGKVIHRYQWSKLHYTEKLFLGSISGDGARWTLPKDVPAEYIRQIQNVERVKIVDPVTHAVDYEWIERGRHDYPDCEKMQEVAADICGV